MVITTVLQDLQAQGANLHLERQRVVDVSALQMF